MPEVAIQDLIIIDLFPRPKHKNVQDAQHAFQEIMLFFDYERELREMLKGYPEYTNIIFAEWKSISEIKAIFLEIMSDYSKGFLRSLKFL
jgi:hypothetical protein